MRWPLQPQMLLNTFQVLHNQGIKGLDVSSVHLPRVLGTEGPRTYSFLRLQIHRQQRQILSIQDISNNKSQIPKLLFAGAAEGQLPHTNTVF